MDKNKKIKIGVSSDSQWTPRIFIRFFAAFFFSFPPLIFVFCRLFRKTLRRCDLTSSKKFLRKKTTQSNTPRSRGINNGRLKSLFATYHSGSLLRCARENCKHKAKFPEGKKLQVFC